MNLLRHCLLLFTGVASWLSAAPASAGQGRLLATGGATQIEGAAGGGIVPWAVLSGYGTGEQHGGAAFYTRVDTGDYALDAYGASYTFGNRLELSFARQSFDLGELQRRLSLPWDTLDQDVYGAKLRVSGDLVYGRAPQISVGVQHKRLRDGTLPLAIGARDDNGTDAYVSASKLFLDAAGGYQLLLNATLRSSNANQTGLLGFGGDGRADRTWLWKVRRPCCWIPASRWAWSIGRSPTTSASPAKTTGATSSSPGSRTSTSPSWARGRTWVASPRWTTSAAPMFPCS